MSDQPRTRFRHHRFTDTIRAGLAEWLNGELKPWDIVVDVQCTSASGELYEFYIWHIVVEDTRLRAAE